MSRQHELKVWPEYFRSLFDGTKTFELRDNDRAFRVGDELWLREYSPATGYTGRECWRLVSYVLNLTDPPWGGWTIPGWVVLGLRESADSRGAQPSSAPSASAQVQALKALVEKWREYASRTTRLGEARRLHLCADDLSALLASPTGADGQE